MAGDVFGGEDRRLDADECPARATLQSEIATLTAANTDLASQLTARTEAAEAGQRLIEELRDAHTTLEQRAIEAEQGRTTDKATAAATIAGLKVGLADYQRTIDSMIEKIGS